MNEWVWSNGGMILTGENWSTGRETLYNVVGRWMNGYGAMVEWYWQGKTEVLGQKHYIVWMVDEWICMENGGMILTGENWSTGRETYHSANSSTKYNTWTDMWSNPALRVEMTTNHVSKMQRSSRPTCELRSSELRRSEFSVRNDPEECSGCFAAEVWYHAWWA